MTGIIIFSVIVLFILVLLPRLRQLDEELTEKYNKKHKWEEKIDQHFNGHSSQRNSFGYQDYKYDEEYKPYSYDNEESEGYLDDKLLY